MTSTPLTIDLSKDWSLYDLTTVESGLRGGPFESETEGAIILPSTSRTEQEVQAHLEDTNKKEELYEAMNTDKPVPNFLGLLNFKEEIGKVIQQIDLPVIDTTEELDEEEHIVLTLHDDKASELDTLDLRLKIFEDDLEDTSIEERVEAHAIFLDEAGNALHQEKLVANARQDLQNSVEFSIGNTVPVGATAERKTRKTRGVVETGKKVVKVVKKIVVVIKKIFGKIKKIVDKIKNDKGAVVVTALRAVKNKLTGSSYKILSYDFANKDFKEIKPTEVNPNKKTLILLHGTIKGSFDGRIGKKKRVKGKGSFKFLRNFQVVEKGVKYEHWFDYLDQKSSITPVKYEQILSFEHETVLDGPKENVAHFIKEWDIRLNQPAAIICASRGSLLAKCMAAHPTMNKRITIDRIAIVSGGYSDYFDKENGIEAYVKMHRSFLPKKAHAFLKSILHVIPKLPGLEVQCKENESFKEFTEVDRVPESSKKVIYYNMTNNFPFDPNAKIDAIAKKFLGDDNDLALSLDAQQDCRPGINHSDFPPFQGEDKHGEGLRLLKPKQQLFKFLTSDLQATLAV